MSRPASSSRKRSSPKGSCRKRRTCSACRSTSRPSCVSTTCFVRPKPSSRCRSAIRRARSNCLPLPRRRRPPRRIRSASPAQKREQRPARKRSRIAVRGPMDDRRAASQLSAAIITFWRWERWQNGYCTGLENRRPQGLGGSNPSRSVARAPSSSPEPELRMIRKALLFVALPTASFAQKGGRSQADKHTPLMDDKDNTPSGPTLRVRDVEDVSPIKRLIDKHKDLKLSDEQMNALKERENALHKQNEQLLKSVDSLVHEIKQASQSTSDESRGKVREAGSLLHATLQQISANYDASATEATASFTPEQQAKAKEILAKLK